MTVSQVTKLSLLEDLVEEVNKVPGIADPYDTIQRSQKEALACLVQSYEGPHLESLVRQTINMIQIKRELGPEKAIFHIYQSVKTAYEIAIANKIIESNRSERWLTLKELFLSICDKKEQHYAKSGRIRFTGFTKMLVPEWFKS